MQLKRSCLLVAVLFTTVAYSQKVLNQSPDLTWRVAPVMGHFSNVNFEEDVASYSKGIVHISDNQALLTVHYPKEEYGVALTDNKGKIKWETRVKVLIISTCKMEDRAIVFFTKNWEFISDNSVIKSIQAASIDINTGKIIAEKEVFTNSAPNFIDVKVNVSPDEQSCYMLIRYTEYNGKGRRTYLKEVPITTDLQLYTFKKDLQAGNAQTIKAKALNAYFLCSSITPDGHLFLISMNDNQLVAEKLNASNGSMIDQLTTTTDFTETTRIKPRLCIEADHIYLTLQYKRKGKYGIVDVYDINWKAKAITQHETALNKEYAQSLKQQNGEAPAGLKKVIEDLGPIAVVSSDKKVAVISQVGYFIVDGFSHSISYYFNEIVVTVFDKEFKKTGSIVIDRNYAAFIRSGETMGINLIGSNLHLLYNKNAGVGRFAATYALLDLDKLTIEQQQTITQTNLPGDAHIEGDATIWFKNTALVPYYITRGVGSKAWTSQFQNISY